MTTEPTASTMTPEQFADNMRAIQADTAAKPADRNMRILAHCLDALETLGYARGTAIAHDMIEGEPRGQYIGLRAQ